MADSLGFESLVNSYDLMIVQEKTYFGPTWVAQLDVHPTGDQEVAGLTQLCGSFLSWRFIMKYFLLPPSPFLRFKKGSCRFLSKECAQDWLMA